MTVLSEYEKKRLENIKRNQEVLASLNIKPLLPLSLLQRSSLSSSKSFNKDNNAKLKTKKSTDKNLSHLPLSTLLPTRTSLRLRNQPPIFDQPSISIDINATNDSPNESNVNPFKSNRRIIKSTTGSAFNPIQDFTGEFKNIFTLSFPSKNHAQSHDYNHKDNQINPHKNNRNNSHNQINSHINDYNHHYSHKDNLDYSVLMDSNNSFIFKTVPDRIYSIAIHPNSENITTATGSKEGYLGFWNIKIDQNSNHEKIEYNDNIDYQSDQTDIEIKNDNSDHDHYQTDNRKRRKRRINDSQNDIIPPINDSQNDIIPPINDSQNDTNLINESNRHFMFKPCNGSISTLNWINHDSLLISSYDGSLQILNVEKESFEPLVNINNLITCVDIEGKDASGWIKTENNYNNGNGNNIYYSDNDGMLHRLDRREGRNSSTRIHQKKCGYISISPPEPHYLSSASLENCVNIWDLRWMKFSQSHFNSNSHSSISLKNKKGNSSDSENSNNNNDIVNTPLVNLEYNRAITAVHYHPQTRGLLTSTCYDNHIRIHHDITDGEKRREMAINHNNQTGRWITTFKAKWNPKSVNYDCYENGNKNSDRDENGENGEKRDNKRNLNFKRKTLDCKNENGNNDESGNKNGNNNMNNHIIVGNMERGIDFIDPNGMINSCYSEWVTSQPAVIEVHPNRDIMISGHASGKLILWQ